MVVEIVTLVYMLDFLHLVVHLVLLDQVASVLIQVASVLVVVGVLLPHFEMVHNWLVSNSGTTSVVVAIIFKLHSSS